MNAILFNILWNFIINQEGPGPVNVSRTNVKYVCITNSYLYSYYTLPFFPQTNICIGKSASSKWLLTQTCRNQDTSTIVGLVIWSGFSHVNTTVAVIFTATTKHNFACNILGYPGRNHSYERGSDKASKCRTSENIFTLIVGKTNIEIPSVFW